MRYKYPKRNDRYLIFRMMLKTSEDPSHWKVRRPNGRQAIAHAEITNALDLCVWGGINNAFSSLPIQGWTR